METLREKVVDLTMMTSGGGFGMGVGAGVGSGSSMSGGL